MTASSLGQKPFAKLTAWGGQPRARAFCGPACSQRKRSKKGIELRMSISSMTWSCFSSGKTTWEEEREPRPGSEIGFPPHRRKRQEWKKNSPRSVKHGGPEGTCDLSGLYSKLVAVLGLKARAVLFICVLKNNKAKTEKEIPLIYLHYTWKSWGLGLFHRLQI